MNDFLWRHFPVLFGSVNCCLEYSNPPIQGIFSKQNKLWSYLADGNVWNVGKIESTAHQPQKITTDQGTLFYKPTSKGKTGKDRAKMLDLDFFTSFFAKTLTLFTN